MSQPVKLSDELVLDARISGLATQRSIAGQVEFWARLGRRVERSLSGARERGSDEVPRPSTLAESVATVGTPEGRRRLDAHLESLPFPRYKAHPTEKGKLIRTEEDGTRTVGRFVNRKFEVDAVIAARKPVSVPKRRPALLKAGRGR
jgi:hypothetical protein